MNTTRVKSGTRLRDVAAAAGVSMATVSAVVNGRAEQYGIAPATRRRIEDLIRQMDYTPSIAARDMAAGRNPLLGLAIAAGAPASDHLIEAIQTPLAAAGFRLLVMHLPSDTGAAESMLDDFTHAGIAGLIYCPPSSGVGPLPDGDCPAIAIDGSVSGLPAVYADEREAGRQLARRFVDNGHRAIAVMGSSGSHPEVLGGFMEVCAQTGVVTRSFGSVSEFTPFMTTIPAVLCISSAVLLEVYSEAWNTGNRPGSGLSVVAVDDQGLAGHLNPRPVVYQPNTVELGRTAARLIQQAIQGSIPGDVRLASVISEGTSIRPWVTSSQPSVPKSQPPPQVQTRPVAPPVIPAARSEPAERVVVGAVSVPSTPAVSSVVAAANPEPAEGVPGGTDPEPAIPAVSSVVAAVPGGTVPEPVTPVEPPPEPIPVITPQEPVSDEPRPPEEVSQPTPVVTILVVPEVVDQSPAPATEPVVVVAPEPEPPVEPVPAPAPEPTPDEALPPEEAPRDQTPTTTGDPSA